VHNDFHKPHGIFPIFDGLTVPEFEKPLHVIKDLPIIQQENGINGHEPAAPVVAAVTA
jgi:hypothetical protein